MVARSLPEPLRELRRSAAAIPALIMVGVFVALGAAQGGYFETTFLPAALLALALLVAALVSISTRAEVPRTVLLAVGLFGAYAVWSYLSILWSGDQGAAWEGANRALMYALVFALFALWPMRGRPAAAIIGAFGLGIAGLGLVTLLRADAAGDVSDMFVRGRFVEPVGYTNGNAALWFSGFLPCIYLAGRREFWAPVRGLALGGACLLAGLSLLGQSRGWLAALPIVLVLFFAIVPGRARNGVAVAAVVAGAIVALDPILAVFEGSGEGGELEPLIGGAVSAILLASAFLAVVATAVAFADRALEVDARTARRARMGTAALLALAVLAVTVALAATADPIGQASDAWEEFKTGVEPSDRDTATTRFTSAGGQDRYDYWTVALSQFSDDPLIGDGTGNFQNAYLREGESPQRPRFPHSLAIRLLSETGLVGALLFLAGTAAALLAGARAVRESSAAIAAAAAAAAIATFAYWAVHGSVDWFYELPALAASAFAMLGLAAGLMPRRWREEPRRSGSDALVGGWPTTALMALPAVAAAFALGLPWLAQLHVAGAIDIWSHDPDRAFERLDRAADLNPLSIEPHATGAAIALRLELPDVAHEEFEAVLERDSEDAYSTLQLGAFASQRGQDEVALRLLRHANELSPRDALVDDALDRARAGERLDPTAIFETALERRSSLTKPQ